MTKVIVKKEETEDMPVNVNEGQKAELTDYLSVYHNTKFDWKVIAHRIDLKRRPKIVQALELLVEDGLLVKHTWQGSYLYSIIVSIQ